MTIVNNKPLRTLNDLANYCEQLATELPEDASNMAKSAAMEIIADLAQSTPVDVGSAVSNWQVSVGSVPGIELPAFAPSPSGRMIGGVWTHSVPPETTRPPNASAMIEQAEAALASKAPGEMVFIANVLPYIGVLNDGSSEQAPSGFVERAVIIGRKIIDNLRLRR